MDYRNLRIAWSIMFCLAAVAAVAIFAPLIYDGPGTAKNPLRYAWLFAALALVFSTAPWISWSTRFSLRSLIIAMTLAAVVLGAVYAATK